ncbi:hypothetical protein [Streptomyces sp. 1222.5]|uniref:hypothetical protein n=1 Tax=Streptomyces sp. 1222.5 TaxID=1881026 RepID=UPI003EBCEAD4
MICARCSQPIRRDEERKQIDHPRPTGPGLTVYVHAERCQPAPQQTTQARRFGV